MFFENLNIKQYKSLKQAVILPLEISEDIGWRDQCNVNCDPTETGPFFLQGSKNKKTKDPSKINQTILPPQILHIPPIPKQKRLNNRELNATEFNG